MKHLAARSAGATRVRPMLHSLTIVAVLSVGMPAIAQDVLGSAGEWQLSKAQGASGISGDVCVIATVSEIEGGRRERPRIRIVPDTREILIDPDRSLSAVITGVAALEHQSERRQPRRVLEHRVRIDDGKIFTQVDEDPRFGAVEVTRDEESFARLMRSMADGSVLRYEWQLDRGSRSYEYSLDGFSAMRDQAVTDPACQAQ